MQTHMTSTPSLGTKRRTTPQLRPDLATTSPPHIHHSALPLPITQPQLHAHPLPSHRTPLTSLHRNHQPLPLLQSDHPTYQNSPKKTDGYPPKIFNENRCPNGLHEVSWPPGDESTGRMARKFPRKQSHLSVINGYDKPFLHSRSNSSR